MILQFRVKNFRSLRDEQSLSLVASSDDSLIDNTTEVPIGRGFRLLKTAAIYGANASGKTNVLRALEFMATMVRNSHRDLRPGQSLPTEPFLLEDKFQLSKSELEIEFINKGVRHTYGFSLNKERIFEEWLFHYPKNKKTKLFDRSFNKSKGEVFTFGTTLHGQKKAIRQLTRPNSLFLSTAAQNNHKQLSSIFDWFVQHIAFCHPSDRLQRIEFTREMLEENEKLKKVVLHILEDAEIGIVDIDYKQYPVDDKALDLAKNIFKPEEYEKVKDIFPDVYRVQTGSILKLHHKTKGKKNVEAFDLRDESRGTQNFLSLIGPLIMTFSLGSVLMIDELETSMHPIMARRIIELFNSPGSNPKNGQLIFTTHDTQLLESNLLRRDQVWFTEKDSRGATHLYPLTDFRPRKSENLAKGYLKGRYGAIPFPRRIES